MKLIKIIKKDGEIIFLEQGKFNALKKKGFGTFAILQNKEGQLRYFNNRKLYTHTFETTTKTFKEHDEIVSEFKSMNGVETVNVPINLNARFILVFENKHDRYLFQDIIKNEFGDKVEMVDTGGKDSKKIRGVMRAIEITGLSHLFVRGGDGSNISIAETFQDAEMNTSTLTEILGKGPEIISLMDYFISKKYYPSWLSRFFPLTIPRASSMEIDKERLLEIIEKEKQTISKEKGPISDLINNYFDIISQRVEHDISGNWIPLMDSRWELYKALYGVNEVKLKKVIYHLPKYISKEFKKDELVNAILDIVRDKINRRK